MSKYYTKLKLEVSDMIDISLIRYDVTVTYKSLSAKPTSSKSHSLGKNRRFSSNGLSEKHNLSNRGVEEVRYYIKDIKGELIKDIAANPLSKDGRASRYKLKTTPAPLKRDPKNNKIVGVDTTEVAWMIIEKQESVHSFLTRIYEYPYRKDIEEVIFRKNNQHLTGNPILSLYPGDFIILSNASNDKSKELARMKQEAKAAKIEFDKTKKEFRFDSERFARNIDFLHDVLSNSEYVALTDKTDNQQKPSDSVNYAAVAAGTSQGIVTFNEVGNKKVTEAYSKIVEAMDYEKSNRTKFANPENFKLFKKKYSKLFKNFDNSFSQSYFKYNSGIQTGKLRQQIKKNVYARSPTYKGGIKAYVKNFRNMGKVDQFTKVKGNLLVAASVADATMNVSDAYKTGDSSHTQKTIIKETLKLEGSLGGGALGTGAVTLVATAFGIGTGGIGFILIGVIAAGAGVASGYYGSKGGAELADLIYQ
ncbi:hypothetical protein ACTXJ5_04965 [Psychrobacter alimentarius]|uniref:hypothetical protein n=1 Tax=Psychrobacter alimentarius TaxID=261164 RepID=UPI003FD22FC6